MIDDLKYITMSDFLSLLVVYKPNITKVVSGTASGRQQVVLWTSDTSMSIVHTS